MEDLRSGVCCSHRPLSKTEPASRLYVGEKKLYPAHEVDSKHRVLGDPHPSALPVSAPLPKHTMPYPVFM